MKRFWALVLVACMLALPGLDGSLTRAREDGTQGIVIASFVATAQMDSILVDWETATEVGLLGFDLYREDESGQLIQLNDALILSQGFGSPPGAYYQWVDVVLPSEYLYWLDLVDVCGRAVRYGPAITAFPAPQPVEASFAPTSSTIVLGDTVSFTNLSTGDGPLTYTWASGDGSPPSSAEHPIHTYNSTGSFTVILTATNLVDQDVATGTVEVNVALTVKCVGSGATDPALGTHVYSPGTVVTMTAEAEPGWDFVAWSGDLASLTSPGSIVMTGNKIITARFDRVFTLTMTKVGTGSGTLGPNVGSHSVVNGTQVVLTAVPAAGSTFGGWSGDVVTTTNPLTMTMIGGKVITARFDRVFTLTVAEEGTGDGTPDPDVGAHSCTYGARAVLTAVPAPGSTFGGWSGVMTTTTNPLTITMVSDMLAIATFEQASYRILLPLVVRNR